jgi:site-specific DNA recombinase
MKPTPTAVTQTRAVIYCRISQDRTGAGLGVDRQREDCEALAERNGWDVVEVYVDNDVSAYSGKKRKDYRRMLADLEQGTATVVIAWHTDRLHRSPTELEEYIDLSERRGVATHTVQAGTIDLATPSGRMTARILGAVARQESEHKGTASPGPGSRRPWPASGRAGSARSAGACPPARRRRRPTGRPARRSRSRARHELKAVPEEAEALRAVDGHDPVRRVDPVAA